MMKWPQAYGWLPLNLPLYDHDYDEVARVGYTPGWKLSYYMAKAAYPVFLGKVRREC